MATPTDDRLEAAYRAANKAHNKSLELPDNAKNEFRLDYLGQGIEQGADSASRIYEATGNPLHAAGGFLAGVGAGITNDVTSIATRIKSVVTGDETADDDYPVMTPESYTAMLSGVVGGDDSALERKYMKASGESEKLKENEGFMKEREVVDQVKQTGQDLLRTAALGALGEAWNKANGMFSAPVSNVANTLEQAMSADNKRDI